jgi:hypothetical protein
MDKMHRLFLAPRTTDAGMFGAFFAGVGLALDHLISFLAGDEIHKAIGAVLLILFAISSSIAIASAWYRFRSTEHKERRDAIEQQLIELKACAACLAGGPEPDFCAIEPSHRSPLCRKEIRKAEKTKNLLGWRKRHLPWIFNDETTK